MNSTECPYRNFIFQAQNSIHLKNKITSRYFTTNLDKSIPRATAAVIAISSYVEVLISPL